MYQDRFKSSFRGRRGGRKTQNKSGLDPQLLVRAAQLNSAEETYTPKYTFTDFNISQILKKNILGRGYKVPTPIQDQAIPALLDGRDVVGIANTGTGKTAAYLIPLINKIALNRSQKVLIVAPTRELAMQIDQECKAFSFGMAVYSNLCVGGNNIQRQIYGLQRSPHFVIGTPGRLLDLKRRGYVNSRDFTSVVLDEVDRMLDMGFIHDIKALVSDLPVSRQSLFFSATLPDQVKTIMTNLLKDPVTVTIKSQKYPANIEQNIVRTCGKTKIDTLHDLLIKDGFSKVLIFGRTKRGVEQAAAQLTDRGFKVGSLHGDKNQAQRRRALQDFKDNKFNIMLATDVAARGLDIDNITHVINYDLPENYDDYLHRIGRTGRANKKGVALSFVD